MAASESSLGLKKLEIADVINTGLPTTWVELEDVVIGSAVLAESEPSTEDIFTEQSSQLYRKIVTQDGVKTLTFEVYDVSPANLALLKGGTATAATSSKGSTWQGSTNTVQINKAVKLTTLDNYTITIPNGSVISVLNWTATKQELAKVTVTITALAPKDVTLGDVIVEAPDKTA